MSICPLIRLPLASELTTLHPGRTLGNIRPANNPPLRESDPRKEPCSICLTPQIQILPPQARPRLPAHHPIPSLFPRHHLRPRPHIRLHPRHLPDSHPYVSRPSHLPALNDHLRQLRLRPPLPRLRRRRSPAFTRAKRALHRFWRISAQFIPKRLDSDAEIQG